MAVGCGGKKAIMERLQVARFLRLLYCIVLRLGVHFCFVIGLVIENVSRKKP
jgi:hypothetical protein